MIEHTLKPFWGILKCFLGSSKHLHNYVNPKCIRTGNEMGWDIQGWLFVTAGVWVNYCWYLCYLFSIVTFQGELSPWKMRYELLCKLRKITVLLVKWFVVLTAIPEVVGSFSTWTKYSVINMFVFSGFGCYL